MSKKIGFRNYDAEEEENSSFDKRIKEMEILIGKLINSTYDFKGNTERKVFKTSSELAFEFNEMIEVPSKIIALVLHRAECEIVNVDGLVCWVLYEKE